MLKSFSSQMENLNLEGLRHLVMILDYQEEAVLDEDVTIRELYMVLRMGVLRFYLCTKCLTDNDEESDVNNNAQHK